MATEVVHTGSKQYRLRAGAPIPIGTNNFVLHTFMAEENPIILYECTDTLPLSSSFRGQGGSYMGAQFSRIGDHTGAIFTGKIIDNVIYIDECRLGTTYNC